MRWWVGVLLLMTTSFLTAQPTMPDWWLAADGLRDPDDLPLYRQIGLTVLWVSVPYRPDGDLSGYDRLLDTADQLGMPYIIALDLRPPAMRPPIRCAPHDVNYLLWLRRWLDIAIPYFRNRPNLLGYALGQRVDEAISYDDEGFALFLRQKYGTLERLQQAWQLPVRDRRIAQLTAMQADDELSPLRYSRPSLDVALYHWTTLRNLLVLWAEEVRRRDPERMLIAGPLTTYRSLAVVPPGYQAIVPFLSPEGSERDWLTHNCHAVAIARRGGRFRALPMLTVRSQDGRIVTEEALLRWAVAALAQGASGFVLNDWSALKESEPLRLSVMALRHRLKAEVPPDATPRPKTAVLYTPFAEGVLSPEGFPLYGFAIPPRNTQALPLRLGINEPATLFAWLRFHGWGIVDCLTPEELTPEFLGKYRTLLAPMPAYLDEGMQRNLATFVANGGIFVADFGTGAFQAEIPFQTLPTGLRELLGVWAMQQVLANMELRAEMTVLFPHPLFPDLPEGTHLGDLENSFGLIMGFASGFQVEPWAESLTMRRGRRFIRRERQRRVQLGPRTFAGIFINPYGRGYAIFATTLLWALWTPQTEGFVRFHADLLGRFASAMVIPSGFPPPAWMSEADKGIWVINPTAQAQQVSVRLRTPIFYAFNEGTAQPIAGSPAAEEVTLALRPNDWVFLRPVAEVSVPVSVRVEQLMPQKVQLRLDAPKPMTVALRIIGDRYRLNAPSHKVIIATQQGSQERIVPPDHWGFVPIADVPIPSVVTVTPAEK
ncbi:MAG: hypothetical protein NOOUEUKL_002043 [Candidatus Fervidibacter sp.]